MPFKQNPRKKKELKGKKKTKKEGIEQSQSKLFGYSFAKQKFYFL